MNLKLVSKLLLSTSIVLLVTIALFAYFNITTLKTLLLAETVSAADKQSDTIIRTTHHQMLEDDRTRVYQMVHEVGSQHGIERIRMINKNGRIIFSTDDGEIGTMLDKQAAACNMCHASKNPVLHATSMNRSRVFYTAEGKQVLGLAKAIYNEESCSAASCHFHPASSKVLGILDVIVSLEEMNAQLIAYRNKIIILTAILLILTSFSIAVFMQKFVNSPVKQLLKHTQKLAQGELGSGVQFTSNDELGELASSFNVMSQNLMKARNELEDWGKRLEVKVTERTRELTNIQAQLIRSEKLASLGELVAGIAHEINNPLTGIMVYSSLMIENPILDPALKNDLATIVRETQRCAQIVRGLLDFSRETIPQKEPASLNEIMEVTLALVGNQSFFHDIVISKEYASRMPKIPVDPNQIEQVFVNILINASQAMEGSGQLQIRTGLTADRLAAFVSITDTGCGISEEHLGKIFDPFFSTKETRGTGLGLAVSYGIIENHGGNIEVQSVVGKGSTFTIWLPLSQGVQQQIPMPVRP